MDDEYNYTARLDNTIALESANAESHLLNLDMNTEVLDVCESAQDSDDQMEDYSEKEVVLDSDDEGGNQNEAVNLVNGCFPMIGRSTGRNAMRLLRRQQVPAGFLRRLDNNVGEHVFLHVDSAKSDRSNAESTAGRTCLYNDNRFQEHQLVVDSVVSRSSDQKPIPMNPEDLDYLSLVRESSKGELLDDRKLSSHESNYMDMGKDTYYDCKLAELDYVESQEGADAHNKALSFVDHYLSVNDLGSCKDIQTRKTNMTKSPPSLRSQGSQSLARRVNLGCTASKLTTFDWAEKQIEKSDYTSLSMNKDWILKFGGGKSGCLSVNQESDSKISNLQSKEKLPVNLLSLNDLNTELLNSNDTDKIGSNSGICLANESVELDKQLDAGLSMQNVDKFEQFRLMPDALDIGMDTQVAAEAMEELTHAVPPGVDACITHLCSDNSFLDCSNTVNNKSKSNHVASHEKTIVGWRCKEKRSKRMKISNVQHKSISLSGAKQFKNQRGTAVRSLVTKNLMTEKLMNGEFLNNRNRNPRNTRNRKCGAPSGIAVQQEEYEFTERYSLKEFQKHYCLCDRRSKETTGGIVSDSPLRRKKMISFHEDVQKIGVKRTCLKSNFGSSFGVKTDTSRKEENSNLNVSDGTFSELNLWVYPKRKRSHQCRPCHPLSSSNQCSPSAAIENHMEKYPIVNEEVRDRVPKLLVYNRQRKFPFGRDHIGSSLKVADDLSSSVNNSAVSYRKVQMSIGSDTNKPLMQCGILDDLRPSFVDASSNMKSDLSSNGRSMTLQVLEGGDKRKQTFNPFFRSPLMKELTRLGYTESLPDFLPKDSRRRRANEKVCILFSQNLETSTLKQQKKIVARLGLSIASCCSDATHFVTNRFVRTRNMLEAIALGKPVVTHLWLESCEQAGCIIDEKSYILRDEKKEKEIGFNMPVSLSRASQLPLLKGRRVLITAYVKPCIDVINGLVKAVQGQVVTNTPNDKTKDKLIPDDLLIISCEEDYTICLQFLEKGASIYDSELLLNGIVTQKLEYERYRLFKDFKANGHSCLS